MLHNNRTFFIFKVIFSDRSFDIITINIVKSKFVILEVFKYDLIKIPVYYKSIRAFNTISYKNVHTTYVVVKIIYLFKEFIKLKFLDSNQNIR